MTEIRKHREGRSAVVVGMLGGVGLFAAGVLIGGVTAPEREPAPAVQSSTDVVLEPEPAPEPAGFDYRAAVESVADVAHEEAEAGVDAALGGLRRAADSGIGAATERFRSAVGGGRGRSADCEDAIRLGPEVPAGPLATWPDPLLDRAHVALEACAASGGFGGGGVLAETAAAVAAERARRGR